MKPTIFISHITEEREIAISLKKTIEKEFLRTVEVFVSSHEDDIKLGDSWLSNIKSSLEKTQLLIVLCSPLSSTRPWINFEAGTAWLKNIPVIPLCHSGISPSQLHAPLNSLQGGNLNDREVINQIFKRIANIADIDCPEIKDDNFFTSLKGFENQIKTSLLVKDTEFIFSMLYKSIQLIKYDIVGSFYPMEKVNEISSTLVLSDLNLEFNQMYNLFNYRMLGLNNLKVYQSYYKNVLELIDNVKFILSYKKLKISDDLVDVLEGFVLSIVKISFWYESILVLDHNDGIKETCISLIKETVTPDIKQGNLINYFIDYYDSILHFKKLIELYEQKVYAIINLKNQ